MISHSSPGLPAETQPAVNPDVHSSAVAKTFRDPEQALMAAKTGVALLDRSHWGRLLVTGEAGLEYLHNQSTNDLKSLQPGQGCNTVFVTATAQILDLTTAYLAPEGVILITSPQRRQALLTGLGRLIAFVPGAQLVDQTAQTRLFSLIGPGSTRLLHHLGLEHPPQRQHHHQPGDLAGYSLRIAAGSGLSCNGYTLLLAAEQEGGLWHTLVQAGAIPASDAVWQQLRIEQGRPAADHELTEAYNPLEAGLWQAISLTKGCYIGQEVLAKQVTYQRIRQKLWGIRLSTPVEVGTAITVKGDKEGILTSITATQEGYVGLGYVRTRVDQAITTVQVGDVSADLIQLPYLTYPPGV
jgi:hypothetical protein